MKKRIELGIGERYGRWTVIGPREPGSGPTRHLCRCDCGTEKVMKANVLRRRDSNGCQKCKSVTHGDTYAPEYAIYRSMIARCRPCDRQAKDYSKRGIRVCEEWTGDGGYLRFLGHVGRRPSDEHTLDRIDNDKGYEPGNVRWATSSEQARNRRTNHVIVVGGESRCVKEWSEISGVDHRTILARIRRGWPAKDAVFRKPDRGFRLQLVF